AGDGTVRKNHGNLPEDTENDVQGIYDRMRRASVTRVTEIRTERNGKRRMSDECRTENGRARRATAQATLRAEVCGEPPLLSSLRNAGNWRRRSARTGSRGL